MQRSSSSNSVRLIPLNVPLMEEAPPDSLASVVENGPAPGVPLPRPLADDHDDDARSEPSFILIQDVPEAADVPGDGEERVDTEGQSSNVDGRPGTPSSERSVVISADRKEHAGISHELSRSSVLSHAPSEALSAVSDEPEIPPVVPAPPRRDPVDLAINLLCCACAVGATAVIVWSAVTHPGFRPK